LRPEKLKIRTWLDLVPLLPTLNHLEQSKMLDISSRLQLFVDDQLTDRLDGVQHRLHHPVPREVALTIDQPWEKLWQRDESLDPTPFGYSSVMKDGDIYRMYYTWDVGRRRGCLTGYAESRDGIVWEKPNLGIVEFERSKDNNLVWVGPRHFDFTPFRDANPDANPDELYKTLIGLPHVPLASPDGIHWRQLKEEAVLTDGAFDSQNIVFWDTDLKCYVAYYRDFVKAEGESIRVIKRAVSGDFLDWPPGELLDYGGAPLEHFYTNGIIPYYRAPDLYVGFPMRFVPGRKAVPEHSADGVSDAVFMFSRDGLHWDRRFMEGFVRPGLDRENWTERNFLMTWGIVPAGPAEMSIYWVEHFRHPTNRIRRGVLRTDGFVSINASYKGGQVLTKPLMFQGGRLLLNYSTSAVGKLRVELLSESGEPVAGFSGEDAPDIYGDQVKGEYRWNSETDISQLAGKPIRLRLSLKDADLYSFRFCGPDGL